MIHPIILWQLARSGAGLAPRLAPAARRRVWRPLGRPGRRQAIDDPTVPPSLRADRSGRRERPLPVMFASYPIWRRAGTRFGARLTARLAAAAHARVAFAAVLRGRPEEAASAYRAAHEALERAGAVRDAERAIHELATAMQPRLDVTVTSRTNRATATCDAPNCAGHRARA